jgi:hypothetical protein
MDVGRGGGGKLMSRGQQQTHFLTCKKLLSNSSLDMVCILLSSASITTLHPEQSSTFVVTCGGVTSLNPASFWKQKATCVNYDTTYLPEY